MGLVRTSGRRRRLGLVVPSLEQGGGVPSVAEFVCSTVESAGTFDVSIVSLAVSFRDELGVALTRPSSWLRGVGTTEGIWRGRRFIRIGAAGSELEFRRYQPRPALREALSDCDLIQVVCGSPAWACAVSSLGKPVAVHCATRALVERKTVNTTARGPLGTWRRWMTRVTDRVERKVLRSVDAIQVENSWMRDYVRQLNTGRRVAIRFVPPGVDVCRFLPLATRDLLSRPYILCVGRLSDQRKNVGLLLQAFAAIPGNVRARVRLVLAGCTGPPTEFWDHVGRLGLRDVVSYVPSPSPEELVRLYQSASVFALVSNEEGFGIVIIEAMACGIPVVATRCGGPDDVVRDGTDGYLVGLNDPAGLADRLTRLLSDDSLNTQMGKAARQAVLSRYDKRIAGRALLDTYDTLLASPAGFVRQDPREPDLKSTD